MLEVKEAGSKTKSLDDFRGDFAAVAELILKSWSENNQQPILYGETFLESCFQYPGASFSLAPTIYDEGNPIAFVAGFPRKVRCQGRELRVLLITFLTVSSEYKKKGYGVILWSELASRARAAGFEGLVNYCVAGSAMDAMILGCCQRLKLPTACVFSIEYMSGLVPAFAEEESPRGEAEANVDLFLSAASELHEPNSVVRIWSRAEADWQCVRRTGAVAAAYRKENRQGMLTGYVAPIMNSTGTKCLFFEDVLWSELKDAERFELLEDLLCRARGMGAEMATAPRCGYADTKAFSHAGFCRTRRIVRAFLSVWDGIKATDTVPSFYLGVL